MITSTTSRKGEANRRQTCAISTLAIVVVVLRLASVSVAPVSAAGPTPSVTTDGSVLDRVERKIAKEPKYLSTPRYALLVFGTKADSQVWMVEDGKTLYVDKNANGDLTDDGPPITPTNVKEWMLEGTARYQFEYVLDEITPVGGAKHTDFSLHRWNYGEKEDTYGLLATLEGQTPMYAGWFSTFWAVSPETVPIIHFGGPMQLKRLRTKEFVIGAGATRLSIAFMNPGRGEGATSRLSIYALPPTAMPIVRIDWPVPDGAASLQTSHTLMQRCCYWEFYDPDFKVPPGVVPGTATATVSLPEGVFPFELTTNQIEFSIRAKVSVTAAQ